MDMVLHDYLGSITTPENQSTLMRSMLLLDRMGLVTHHDDVGRILHSAEKQESQQNLLDLFTLLTVYTGDALQEFGIEVGEAVPLLILNEIVEAITILPNYGDPEYLLAIVHGVDEVGGEETLCELLEVVSPKDWFAFIPYIENVSDALMERLKSLYESRLPEEAERKDIGPQRDRLLSLGATNTRMFAMEWLRQGGRFNTPLETLITNYEEDLRNTKRPEDLALELLGLLIASDTPPINYKEVIKDILDDLVDDPFGTTKVYNAALTLLKELHLEKA